MRAGVSVRKGFNAMRVNTFPRCTSLPRVCSKINHVNCLYYPFFTARIRHKMPDVMPGRVDKEVSA